MQLAHAGHIQLLAAGGLCPRHKQSSLTDEMTPRQRHGAEMPRDVMIHELGHAIVRAELGVFESGIELCDPSTGEPARAHFSARKATPRMMMIRGLAGIYTQAQIAPESFQPELLNTLRDGTFFSRRRSWIELQKVPPDVQDHGFQGDWCSVVSIARSKEPMTDGIIGVLDEALRELQAFSSDWGIGRRVELALTDFNRWFDEDDQGIEHVPMLIYRYARLREFLNTNCG